MSKFVKSKYFETEFEGDTVSMRIKPLKRKHMMELAPFMPEDNDADNMGTLDSMNMLDLGAKMLPGYLEDFKGLKDDEGNALAVEDIVEEMYFLNLVSEIMTEVFQISGMSPKSAENSQGQPDTSSMEAVLPEDIKSPESPASHG